MQNAVRHPIDVVQQTNGGIKHVGKLEGYISFRGNREDDILMNDLSLDDLLNYYRNKVKELATDFTIQEKKQLN